MSSTAFKALSALLSTAPQSSGITDIYEIGTAAREIKFDLRFAPVGVAAVTDAFLDGARIILAADGDLNYVLGPDTGINGKNLILYINVAATDISGAPVTPQVIFELRGGPEDYAPPPLGMLLRKVGDSAIFSIDITFFS